MVYPMIQKDNQTADGMLHIVGETAGLWFVVKQ